MGPETPIPFFFRVSGHVDIEKRAETGVHPGEAVLVQTGSMIPEQATAVLMVEYTESYAADKIVAYRAVSEGENIIQIGEDIKAGESLIPRGRKISARDIGMMAALWDYGSEGTGSAGADGHFNRK